MFNTTRWIFVSAFSFLFCLALAPPACAGSATGTASAAATLPVLLAKSWAIGYALVFLAILLGSLAVLIPAMRKSVRKRSN